MQSLDNVLTNEDLAPVVAAYNEHGSIRGAARALDMVFSTVRMRVHLAARRGLLGTEPVLPGFRIKKTTAVTDKDGELAREFVQQVPENGEPFALPPGHIIKGISTFTDADGKTIAQWTKTRIDDATPHLVEALKRVFSEHDGKSAPELVQPPVARRDEDLCSVYPIADQHNGLLAWGKETGSPYDLKIGAERLRESIRRLVEQSPPSERAIILNLGDWQHTDDQKNMTPRSGNILDVDSRYFKILTAGVQLMKDCIELALQKHNHVLVRSIPGNHDPHAAFALTIALAAFYSNNPRVTIDDSPGEYFWHRFGQTLIGATHGHRMKPDRMAMAMATICREDWGQTRFHWFLFGHIHHETAKEVGDVRCESFQTLASNDAHHHHSGYVAGRSLVSVTLHREHGEIGRHRVNIAPPTNSVAST